MKELKEEVVNDLLITTQGIIEKYNAIARETGSNFNIFEVARIEDKEIIVCRVLAELLDPKGRHGQGSEYLRLFLNNCLGYRDAFSDSGIENMKVSPERYTDKGRPIDLVIEGAGRFIPIEVKIYAADQSQQCYDYCMYARKLDSDAQIVYLTLFGNPPTEDSMGELTEDDIVLISFNAHITEWLEKCLALPSTIRKTPIREILIQFISAIKKITSQLEDKPKMEMVELISKTEQNMRSAKAIADSMESCRVGIIKRFFDAFDKRLAEKVTLERVRTDWDYDKWDEVSPDITYMIERDVEPGISVVFFLNDNKYDRSLMVGLGMMRNGEQTRFGDKKTVIRLMEHYGIDDKPSEWCLCYDYVTYEGERLNMIDFNGNYDNYFKLFDYTKFDEIVDNAVDKALSIITTLKNT